MTQKELHNIENLAYTTMQLTIHNARMDYAKHNARFKIGEYIKGFTTILLIDEIKYEVFDEIKPIIHTSYCGNKYEYKNDVLTKKRTKACITDYDNIIKINP